MMRLAPAVLLTLVACGGDHDARAEDGGASGGGEHASLDGSVIVDGSSTVYPVTEAVAEEFRSVAPRVRVTVGVSGTGGGFKRFGAGETDISDASRRIDESEAETCAENGVEYIELPVAFDGIAVVVNPENGFVDHLTVDELRRLWSNDSTVQTWADLRDGWPDREIRLYAPGQDSGTFDYFTDEINGESGNCRPDVTFSEDDNVLVRGVAGDEDGLGFFGFAYYAENEGLLKLVGVDDGDGPVEPSTGTIASHEYSPLSRPIFIYVSASAAERPEVDAFVEFYLDNMSELAAEVGYVPMPDDVVSQVRARYADRATGSWYGQS